MDKFKQKHENVRNFKKSLDRDDLRERDKQRKELISGERRFREKRENDELKHLADVHSKDLEWEDKMRQHYEHKHEALVKETESCLQEL